MNAGHLILNDGARCEKPLWDLFQGFLEDSIGAKGCGCGTGDDLLRSRDLLESFNRNGCGIDVEATLAHFRDSGGYCDAEVLWNVDMKS